MRITLQKQAELSRCDDYVVESPRQDSIKSTHHFRFLLATLLICQPAYAARPILNLPIRCSLGQDCFLQNYFDHEPGSGWKDYTCGNLSYNGHTGTDFRLTDISAMRNGVAVIAAADGVVVGLRDGEVDVPVLMRHGEPDTGKRAAGNAVRIAHGDGWETQYSHMRQGSVAVRMGQQVHAGDLLGLVGLSGNTEFPHVDLTVRHNGRAIDPFSPTEKSTCAVSRDTLWKPELLGILSYIPTGILKTGWAKEAPDSDKARNNKYLAPDINAQAIVFWVDLFGVQKADHQYIEILDPLGKPLLKTESTIPGNKAEWFSYAGKPRPRNGWPAGTYRAVYRLERKGAPAITTTQYLTIY